MSGPVDSPTSTVITDILLEARAGNRDALDRLFGAVYEELRRIAHHALRRERTGHTLGTTGLVHEAYFKLVDQNRVEWNDRAHFFGVASRAMRQILVEYARRRGAVKRGGRVRVLALEEGLVPAEERAEALLTVDEALTRLAGTTPAWRGWSSADSSPASRRRRPPRQPARACAPCSASGAGPRPGSIRS